MSDTLVILLAIAGLLLAAGMLSVVYVRNLRFRNLQSPHASSDITNMTILFQTMRDVLAQQKQLAEDFNRSLDRRVNEIRNIVEVIRKERDMLRESRSQLIGLLERAKELERAASSAAKRPHAPEPTAQASEPASPAPQTHSAQTLPDVEDIVDIPEDDLIANWTGADFVEKESDARPDEEPPPEPVAPEDARAARDAFRTLLNFDDAGGSAQAPGGPEATASQGNGHAPTRAVEQLVYEYSDAGLRVPEIAKELGIGKGEVRLILSLRESRGT